MDSSDPLSRIIDSLKAFIDDEFLQSSYKSIANDYGDILCCRTTYYVFSTLARNYESFVIDSLEGISPDDKALLYENNFALFYEISKQLLTFDSPLGLVESGLRENDVDQFLLLRLNVSSITPPFKHFFANKLPRFINWEPTSLELSLEDINANNHVIFDDGSLVFRDQNSWTFALVFDSPSDLDEFCSFSNFVERC